MGEPVFETERTIARPWQDDEAERMYDMYARWEVSRWLGNPPKPMKHLGEAHTTIERWAGINEKSGFGGIWAVERKSDGVAIGTVLLVELKGGDGEYEIGWHFHPDSGVRVMRRSRRGLGSHVPGRTAWTRCSPSCTPATTRRWLSVAESG